MLGFSPLASVSHADDLGNTSFAVAQISTGATDVGVPVFRQILSLEDISSGQPIVSQAPFAQQHDLVSQSVEAAPPVVPAPTFTAQHFLVISDFLSGQPEIGSVNEQFNYNLNTLDLDTANPIVGNPLVAPDFKVSAVYEAGKVFTAKLTSDGKAYAQTTLDGRLYAKPKLQGKSFVVLTGRC